MIVSNKEISILENINNEATWAELAQGWNLHQKLGEALFEATVVKAKEEGLNNKEVVDKLVENGCTLVPNHLTRKLDYYDFNQELKNLNHGCLSEPETEAHFRELGRFSEVTSATEKVEEFAEVGDELGGKPPSLRDIENRNKVLKKVSNSINGQEPEKSNLPETMPKYFNTDQLTAFRAWSVQVHDLNVVEDKPDVNIMEITSIRDDILNDLVSRSPEWKSARKIMRKLLHPDSGGNTLAYQFYEGFDILMDNLTRVYDYINFKHRVEKLKVEWWLAKGGKV